MTDVDRKTVVLRHALIDLWDAVRDQVSSAEDTKEHTEDVFDYIIDAEVKKVFAGFRE